MSATTRISTDVITAHLSTPVFAFTTIDILPLDLATMTSQIDVYYKDKDSTENVLLVDTVDYTLNTSLKEITILLGPRPLAIGDVITIDRDTRLSSRYLDFAGLSFLNDENVNNNADNLLHLIQEAATGVSNALQKTLDGGAWEGEMLEITNIAPAGSSNSAPTFGQVQDMLAGVSTATINNTTAWTFSGNGSQTSFDLTDAPQGLAESKELHVFVNNVWQVPEVGYSIDTTGILPALTVTTPFLSGDTIYVYTVSGTVSATFNDGSVTASAIANDSINIQHINTGAGVADRFLVIGATGDPVAVLADWTMISDFAAGVALLGLDEMAAPITAVQMGSQQIQGITAGTGNAHAVNKLQMENAIAAVVVAPTSFPIHKQFTVLDEEVTIVLGFVPTFYRGVRGNAGSGINYTTGNVEFELSTTTVTTGSIEYQVVGGDSKSLRIKNKFSGVNNIAGTAWKQG